MSRTVYSIGEAMKLKTDPILLDLIARARNHVTTPAEKHEQLISFVYGQLMGRVGKEHVRRILETGA